MRNYVSLGGGPRQTTPDSMLFDWGYLEFASPRRFSTKKRWLSLAKPNFQLSTLIFQLINIMVYDSYVEKRRFSTKKMLAEPVEAKFSTLNSQFSTYKSHGL